MGNQLRVLIDRPRAGASFSSEDNASAQSTSSDNKEKNALEKNAETAVLSKSVGAAPFPLESLLNEVFLLVLQHLTMTDLQSVGLVNRRFHDLTASVVLKELEVNLCFLATRVRSRSSVGDGVSNMVKRVLERYGSNLRKLSIFGEHVDSLQTEPANFQPMKLLRDSVFVHCSNLTYLDLGKWMELPELLPSSATAAELGNALPRLTHLRMSNDLPLECLPYFPMLKALHSRLSCYDYKEFTKPATLQRLQEMEFIAEFRTDTSFDKYLYFVKLPAEYKVSAVQSVLLAPSYYNGRIDIDFSKFKPSRLFMFFPNMSSLDLDLVGFSDWGWIHLMNKSLAELKAHSCDLIICGYKPEILGASDKLQILEIHATKFPSYSFLKAFSNLHTFRFNNFNRSQNCGYEPLEGMHASLEGCNSDCFPLSVPIQSLEIADGGYGLNSAVEIALERGWKLRNLALELRMSLCYNGSKHEQILNLLKLKTLLLTCQNDLESLNLAGNKNVTDRFMEFLSSITFNRLVNLKLTGCSITRRGVEQLLTRRKADIDSGVVLPYLQLFGVRRKWYRFEICSKATEANVKIMPDFSKHKY